MIDLSKSSLYDLIPINLRDDKDVIAAAKAVDNSTSSIYSSANKLDFRTNKDIKDDVILDALAVDMHVDFYDPTLSPDVKRNIIDNSMILHMEKGTGGAVERALASVGIIGEVVEWFEYNGSPYTFKIVLKPRVDLTKGNLMEIINSYKKETAHFEYFEINILEVFAVIRTKKYTFPVPYPVTGTFHTAPINGVASKSVAEAESKVYANSVPYPVTGTFYCSEGG